MNPKIRTNKYRAVNILYILKTAFIAYLILCSKLLHRNGVSEPRLPFSTNSAVFESTGIWLHKLLISYFIFLGYKTITSLVYL